MVTSDATDDERRWAEAESILHRHPTPSARAHARGRRRVIVLNIFGMSFLGALIGAIAAARSDGHSDTATPPAWQVIAGGCCLALAVLLIIWVAIVQIRSGLWGGAWRSPTVALTRQQRKGLHAQVRGKRPADPLRLPLSRDLARRIVLQDRIIGIFAALTLLWVGQAIVEPNVFHLVALGFFVVFGVVAATITIRETHRAQRFLESTPPADHNQISLPPAPEPC